MSHSLTQSPNYHSHSDPNQMLSGDGHIEALHPAATAPARTPLHHHVQQAVEQYFVELEGEMPTHLYQTILQEVEKPLLEVVLAQTEGNQSKTAAILGLNRGTLRKKMQLYGLM